MSRIYNHRWHAGALRFFHRTNERAIVERRQHDPVYTLRAEALDHLDLLFAIVFAQWAFPNHLYWSALSRKLSRCLETAGMNTLPKLVRRAFWNDGDSQLPLATCPGRSRLTTAEGDHCGQDNQQGQHFFHIVPPR